MRRLEIARVSVYSFTLFLHLHAHVVFDFVMCACVVILLQLYATIASRRRVHLQLVKHLFFVVYCTRSIIPAQTLRVKVYGCNFIGSTQLLSTQLLFFPPWQRFTKKSGIWSTKVFSWCRARANNKMQHWDWLLAADDNTIAKILNRTNPKAGM